MSFGDAVDRVDPKKATMMVNFLGCCDALTMKESIDGELKD